MSTVQGQIQEARVPTFEEMNKKQLQDTCLQLLQCAELGQNSRDEITFALEQEKEQNNSLKFEIEFLQGFNQLKISQINKLQRQIEELHEKRQNFQYAVNDMKSEHFEKTAALRVANAAAQQEIAALREANAAAQQEIAALRETNAAAQQEIAALRETNAAAQQENAA